MPKFLALTSKGLGGVLEQELKSNDFKVLKATQARSLFECNWENLYLAHLTLRSATRILLPILDFNAYTDDELYNQVKKHDFTKYISPKQSLRIVTHINPVKGPFENSMYTSQKVKDAIVDQFRDKFGQRPSVEKNADLQVSVRVKGPQISLSIDLSGDSLTRRGYRQLQGEAPLKEHIAAGLLMLSKWDNSTHLVDPMCGSGTFLIEAALMALHRAPGLFREEWAFSRLKIFQPEAWKKALVKAKQNEKSELIKQIYGFDTDPRMVELARENVENAGLSKYIKIQQRAIKDLTNPFPGEKVHIVCNPPYGDRLKAKGQIERLYTEMGVTLKEHFKQSEAWILSGSKSLTPNLRMKSERSYAVDNNGIDCMWLKYNLY